MNSKVAWLSLCTFCCDASGVTHYVDPSCPTPTAPYTNWSTAATSIQDAVDAASRSDTVLVTNGIYASGSRLMGGVTNRVVVNGAITLESVNGPENTVIRGYQLPGVTNGDAAIRCVYLGAGVLSGFTVTGAPL